MPTVIAVFIGTIVGRFVGWWLSRSILFPAPRPLRLVLAAGWAFGIAALAHTWLRMEDPPFLLKALVFAGGAYVAIPHYRMVAEHTIPPDRQAENNELYGIPFLVFAVSFAVLRFTDAGL